MHDARLRLAAAGLSIGAGAGYELLDQTSALGTSQFMEKARYQRSLEGELARTIASLRSVKHARVHLGLPKRSVFITDRRQPRASVLVDLYPGDALTKGQVASIVHLVASSIPELAAKSVTVVDQQGTLLSESDGDTDIALASKQYDFTRNVEKKYISSIANILEPLVGKDAFKVEVTADVDFTRQEQTSESFNPDLPAVRSEQVFEEEKAMTGMGGPPGAVSNQPPAAGQAPEQNANGNLGQNAGQTAGQANPNRRRQSVKNYELDRTISYTQNSVGRVRRLSVAVVLDDLPSSVSKVAPTEDSQAAQDADVKTASATAARTPIPPLMMENITQLVKDAVGYDPQRGDRVVVLNQVFMAPEDVVPEVAPEQPFYRAEWFMPWMKKIVGWLVALIIMFGVLRPILKNLSAFSESTRSLDMAMPELPSLDAPETTISQKEILLPGPAESYEAQLNAVKSMVAEDPRRVAQVVKNWLSEG
ncbi:MAG: flagellar basal-body MS-ring/collar protein FliF [Gammaproteobacteria bacterium]